MAETKHFSVWMRLLLALSGAACTVLLIQTDSKWSFLLTAALSLILLLILGWKTMFFERLFAPAGRAVTAVAALLAVSEAYLAKSGFFSCCGGWLYRQAERMQLPHSDFFVRCVPWAVALAALPALFGYLLWFVRFVLKLGKRLWQESDFTERLFFLTAGAIFAILIVFTYYCTDAFHGANVGGRWFNFDVIYSADSGYLVHQDVYRNIGAEQNDLRQPLFGVFAMPFAQAAWLISRVLFFLPDSFITIWQVLQMLLFLVAVILLGRMMGLSGAEKALSLSMLCMSYPVLIFSLTAEQYLLAVFYLILLLYLDRDPESQSLSYIAATGSLLTSGIWFPVVTWDRDWKQFLKKTLRLCGGFFGVAILSGRLTTFLDIPSYIGRYAYYAGGNVALPDKLRQYVNFVGSCLMAPPSGIDRSTYSHISWQMLPVTDWSVGGIVILVLALGGILVSRKSRFTRLCGAWLAFSFLLLGLVGWGTIDNGLMLYTLYFGWAYTAMVFRLIDWMLKRVRPMKLIVLGLLTLALGFYNIEALREVLVFATEYFPALGG